MQLEICLRRVIYDWWPEYCTVLLKIIQLLWFNPLNQPQNTQLSDSPFALTPVPSVLGPVLSLWLLRCSWGIPGYVATPGPSPASHISSSNTRNFCCVFLSFPRWNLTSVFARFTVLFREEAAAVLPVFHCQQTAVSVACGVFNFHTGHLLFVCLSNKGSWRIIPLN